MYRISETRVSTKTFQYLDIKKNRCNNCNEQDHYSWGCPHPRKLIQTENNMIKKKPILGRKILYETCKHFDGQDLPTDSKSEIPFKGNEASDYKQKLFFS